MFGWHLRSGCQDRRWHRAVLVAVVAAGCSAHAPAAMNLNTGKLEDQLETVIHQQTGIVAAVSCPRDIPLKKGNTFACTAVVGKDSNSQVMVTQRDDKGNVYWWVPS
jgi:hypothetical protein